MMGVTRQADFLRRLPRTGRIAALAAALLLCATAAWRLPDAAAQSADDQRRVLLLFSNQSMMPASEAVAQGFRSTLEGDAPDRILLFAEYLDADRFPTPEHRARMVTYLREKYRAVSVDLVLAVGPQALGFLALNQGSLLQDVPIVFVGVSESSRPTWASLPNATGVVSLFDPVKTMELALQLQPDATGLVVVTGASTFDKAWEAVARDKLAPFAGRLKTTYLSRLPLAETLQRVGQLSRDTIVLFLSVLEDGTGQKFISRDVAARVAAAASAPVYGVYDLYLGLGIVGGHVATFEAMGAEAARIARRILAGEAAESIAPSSAVATSFVVDWRQLQRWGLSEAALPPDTVVRFKDPSLWDRYREQVVAAIAVVLIQSLLIIGLLLQVRRRRRAEASLRESEERMSLAVASAKLGLWRMDVGTYRIWATDTCRAILGLDPQAALTQQSLISACHPDDRSRATQICMDAIAQGKSYEQEYRVIDPDGSVRWVLDRAQTACDAKGKSLRMTGVVIDITARKQAEEAVRESEERYRIVAETASDAIITIDQKGAVLFANPAAERIFGYSVAELTGSELTMLMPEHLRKVHRTRMCRYLETGRRHISWEGIELPGLHKDGRIIPLEVSFAEVVRNGERIFTGIVRNVAERKLAEEALRESEERYRAVVETQTELICRYLPDTTLTFVNDAYCRYFGRARDALIGTKFIELIPEPARATVLQHIASLRVIPRTEIYEHEVLRSDGSMGWQQWTDHVIFDADGRIAELQGIGRDITGLKRAEAEAKERREQVTHLTRVAILGELSSALAHELNQPLTAILSNAQAAQRILAREPVDLAELREILSDIAADDTRAGEVIRRLRALLRRGEARRQPLDVNEIVAETLELAHSEVITRHVTVATSMASGLPPVSGDRVQLQQVILNLIVNACEAMNETHPNERSLRLSTAADGDDSALIAVADRGPGLSPEVAARLFEPFYTTKAVGLGLGLSISRSIIAAHGGRLWAVNNPEGGSTFYAVLPSIGEQTG